MNNYTFRWHSPYTREDAYALKYQWDVLKKHAICGYSARYVVQDDIYEMDMALSKEAYERLCEQFPDFRNDIKKVR